MAPVIRIPSEIYSRLEQHAQGFDTPANVIERLLNHFEGLPDEPIEYINELQSSHRDTTKYHFNDNIYGKGKLVLAVIKQYVSDHPETTSSDLLSAFPKRLQGSSGVFNKLFYIKKKHDNSKDSKIRYFIKPSEIIKLSDCPVAVSTEWGIDNINDFIRRAEGHGYTITPTND